MAKSASLVLRVRGDITSALSALTGLKTQTLAKTALIGGAVIGLGAIAFNMGKSFDDAYDTIRTGTGATGDALGILKDDFRAVVSNIPTDFETAATAIADLNTRTGLTGEALQDLAGVELELARITKTDVAGTIRDTTRIFGDWGIAVDDQVDTLDFLFRTSQTTGIGLDTLNTKIVNFGVPLRQFGFSFEQSAALLGKFEAEGVNTDAVLAGLKIGLGKLAAAGEEPIDALNRLVGQIQNAGSAGEANALAIEVFGSRAGPDMAAAISEGRFAIDDLLTTLQNGDETILGVAESTKSASESFQQLKNKGMVALEPLFVGVFNAVSKVIDVLSGVPTPVITVIGIFAGLVIGIGLAVKAFAALKLALLSNPFVAITAAVIAIGLLIFLNWDKIVGFLTEAWDKITEIATEVWGAISDFFTGIWEGLVGIATGAFDALVSWWDTTIGIFKDAWDTVWGAVEAVFTAVWDALVGIATTAWELFRIYVDTVLGIYKAIWETAWGIVKAVFTGVWDALTGIARTAWGLLSGFVLGAVDIFKGIWDTLWGGIEAIFTRIWDGLVVVVRTAWGLLSGFVLGAIDLFRDIWDTAWGGLKTFFQTIWDGIVAVVQGAWDLISGIVDDIIEGVQRAIDFVTELPGKVAGAIPGGGVVGNVLGKVGGFLGFAEGGVVPGPLGAPVAAIVHGGETISPAGASGGPTTIIVNIGGEEVGRVLVPVLRRGFLELDMDNAGLGFGSR